MDKTVKYWFGRLFYLGVALLMALGLLLSPATAPPVAAANPDSEWGKVETPTMDDWKIAPGSDAYLPALGMDGETIYVIGTMWVDNTTNVTGIDRVSTDEETARLWKSENGGATWKDITENVLKEVEPDEFAWFNYVVVPMDDSSFVVLAGYLGDMTDPANWRQVVLVSEDGGKSFDLLTEPIEDNKAGTELTDIYSINVAPELDDVHQIAVAGTCDPDFSIRGDTPGEVPLPSGNENGLIYRYQYGGEEYWEDAVSGNTGWINCSAATFIWFSQTMFINDYTLVAVTHNSTQSGAADNKTYVQTGVLYPGDEDVYWNDEAGRGDAALLTKHPTVWWLHKASTASVTLPLDYDGRDDDKRRCLARVNYVINYAPFVPNARQARGTIYTVDNGFADPLEKQIKDADGGQPWLGMVYYYGTISGGGKVVAGALGSGYIDENFRFMSILTWPEANVGVLTDFDFITGEKICRGPLVYRNELTDMDTDERWKESSKPPSGHMAAVTIIAPPAGNKVYCLVTPMTMGIPSLDDHPLDKYDEGGFSVSFDDGDTWQQTGLIDTDVDYLTDVAASPECNTTYVASINERGPAIWWPFGKGYIYTVCDSLWLKSTRLSEGLPAARSYDDHWLRLWYGEISSNFSALRLAPEETTDIDHVYFWDWGTKALYYSDSKGLGEWERDTKSPFDIVDLAAKEAGVVYALSANGETAMFDGSHWPSDFKEVDTELKRGNAIAVHGENVLVGGTRGDVSYSSDAGETFTELENGLPENGDVFVAFDSYYDTNGVVYAVVGNSTDENGVYRRVIDHSEEWENLGADDELIYLGVALDRAEGNPQTSAATGGVLYALYYNWTFNQSGVARCLTPAEEVCCGKTDWDYLEQGETGFDDVLLFAFPLKICGCLTPGSNSKLLAIDFSAPYYNGTLMEEQPPGTAALGRLWSFEDCFAKAAPVVIAPEDGAVINSDPCNCWNDAFTLKWERQCDACEYNVEISMDEDFTELVLPAFFGGNWGTDTAIEPPEGATPNLVVPNRALGDGSCGTTYYWRVRSRSAETGQEIRSPWSEPLTFTIGAGPEAEVTLTNPCNGALDVVTTNIPFTWDAVPDATGYVFSLVNAATDAEVVAPTDVTGTTYTYTGTLSHDTPYLWMVKAMTGEAVFGKATATFTTTTAPVEPEEPSTPAWVWIVIGIAAVAWLVILVLIFRTRRV